MNSVREAVRDSEKVDGAAITRGAARANKGGAREGGPSGLLKLRHGQVEVAANNLRADEILQEGGRELE